MENILLLIILGIVSLVIYTKLDLLSLKESFQTADQKNATRQGNVRTKKNELKTNIINMNQKIDEIKNKYENSRFKNKEFKDIKSTVLDDLKIKMDDINKITTDQVKENNNYNEKIIKDMSDNLFDLESLLKVGRKDMNSYNGFYSQQNGLKLGVSHGENNKYKVKLNSGCLSDKGNLNYGVEICSDNKTQDFDIFRIPSAGFYNAVLEPSLDKVRDTDKIEYPFYVIKSTNTEKCIQNNFGKLSIQPCVVKKSQRWNKLEKVSCK